MGSCTLTNAKVKIQNNPIPGQIRCLDPTVQLLQDRLDELMTTISHCDENGLHLQWLIAHYGLMDFICSVWELYPDIARHLFQEV